MAALSSSLVKKFGQFIGGAEFTVAAEIFLARRDIKLEDQVRPDVLSQGLFQGPADKPLYPISGLIINGQSQTEGKTQTFDAVGCNCCGAFPGTVFFFSGKRRRGNKPEPPMQ